MRDTINMAREAGFKEHNGLIYVTTINDDCVKELKAFEALVRADEREECAKVCDGLKKKEIARWNAYGSDGSCYSASDCAAAIRARGETK